MSRDEPVRRMFSDGLCRWPDIQLPFEPFEKHCGAVLGTDLGASLPFGADLFLCCACAERVAGAAAAFEHETSLAARAAIARIRVDRDFVEETLQALYDKLLFSNRPKVAEYSGRGPLLVWTRVSAARFAVDALRSRRISWQRWAQLREGIAQSNAGPESNLVRAQYLETFQHALEHAWSTLSSQDRGLLRMHVLGRCSIDQIGRVHGVHRATAARWLERARSQVWGAVREQVLAVHGDLTESEFGVIARTVGGDLDLSLSADSPDPVSPSPPVT